MVRLYYNTQFIKYIRLAGPEMRNFNQHWIKIQVYILNGKYLFPYNHSKHDKSILYLIPVFYI